MRKICGIAVVRDYNRFSKFNLHVICGIDKAEIENAIQAKKAADASGDGKAATEGETASKDCEDAGQTEDLSEKSEATVENLPDRSATDKTEMPSEKSETTDGIEPSGDRPVAKKVEPPCDSATGADAAQLK